MELGAFGLKFHSQFTGVSYLTRISSFVLLMDLGDIINNAAVDEPDGLGKPSAS